MAAVCDIRCQGPLAHPLADPQCASSAAR
jgi:hypothetical protein